MKKIIGIDFDDVLMDFNNSLSEYYNSLNGTAFTRKDINQYRLENVWGCTVERVQEILSGFYGSALHSTAKPILGAIEAVERLSRDHKLVIVTARPEVVKEQTETWLEKHFPGIFHSVHYVNTKFDEMKLHRTKADICDQLGIELFIDDSVHNAAAIAVTGKKVLLFDAPWNQVETDPRIERVYSWDEIVRKIEAVN